jgi:hypothetical protein
LPGTTGSPGLVADPGETVLVDGEGAFEPKSRSHSNPRAVSLKLEDQIVRLRKTLIRRGLDAGAETIAAHLHTAGVDPVPAVSTIWRILTRQIEATWRYSQRSVVARNL